MIPTFKYISCITFKSCWFKYYFLSTDLNLNVYFSGWERGIIFLRINFLDFISNFNE